MSRNLKFRAYDKENKKMYLQEDITKIDVIAKKNGVTDYRQLYGRVFVPTEKIKFFEDVEIMQYTGAKDDKGIEIYEGDVLLSANEDGVFLQLIGFGNSDMEYDSMIRGFKIINEKTLESHNYEISYFKPYTQQLIKKHKIPTMVEETMLQDGWWVIGNIYENPELI